MHNISNLKITGKATKNRSRYDLRRFLFVRPTVKNGKKLDIRWFFKRIEIGEVSDPKIERLQLIENIHELLQFRLDSGGSISSIDTTIASLQIFFDFCTDHNLIVNHDNSIDRYFDFCEHLFIRESRGEIKTSTAYGYGSILSRILGELYEIPKAVQLIRRTRLKFPIDPIRTVGLNEDKQNLSDTSKLGTFCYHLSLGLTPEAIMGRLPVEITMPENLVREGRVLLQNPQLYQSLNVLEKFSKNHAVTKAEKEQLRRARVSCGPIGSVEGTRRYFFVNVRVACEFIIFLAQTGCNVSVATNLERIKFKYKPTGEGFKVRAFKKRRGGEVEFDIFKAYRGHLKKYLAFLDFYFPDSDLLFPLYSYKHRGAVPSRINFQSFRKILNKYEIPWTAVSRIRKTRVNWILRQDADEGLTAEMHGHALNTLKGRYEQPSLQRGMVEISKFWNANDPFTEGKETTSIIASSCNGSPMAIPDKPDPVPAPDCSYPSGCLWCENLRDRDSFDYIWCLASLRHLKSIEASRSVSKYDIPPDIIIDRITQKMSWFRSHSEHGNEWISEAEIRIAEGHYHPNFSDILEFLE